LLIFSLEMTATNGQTNRYCFYRRSYTALTSAGKSTFLSAVKRLATRFSTSSATRWDLIAQLHNTYSAQIHGTAHFFFWHRAYLYFLEQLLGMGIPYYDHASDCLGGSLSNCGLLQSSDTYHSTAGIGGTGNSPSYCVSSGALQSSVFSIKPPSTNARCLRRRFSTGALMPIGEVNRIVSASSNVASLRRNAEGSFHAYFHINCGLDMNTMLSPFDPYFFLHHSWIDRLWDSWQRANPARYNTVTTAFESLSNIDTPLPGMLQLYQTFLPDFPAQYRVLTPRQALRMGSGGIICSVYTPAVTLKRDIEADGKDFDQDTDADVEQYVDTLANERVKPDPLPRDYIRMNNLNETEVRGFESKYHRWLDRVNEKWKTKAQRKAGGTF